MIWDFDTRSVAREFVPTAPMPGGDDGTTDDDPHGVAILSVAWSRDGRKVVSAAADGAIVVWDVAESDDVFRATFDAPLHRVAFDPTNASVALVCPSHDGPMTFVLGRGRKKTYLPQMPGGVEAASLVCRIPGRGLDENAASRAPAYAIYSKSARHVFVANNRGVITVVETATMDIVQALKVPDATVVKRIELSKDGLKLLVTSNARALNSYDVAEPDASSPSKGQMSHTAGVLRASTTYLNATHRSQWAAAAYTSDGAYVVGASAGSSHELHVWETNSGALVRILQGGADTKGITQIAPHPLRSLVVAVGANGTLYVWSKSYVENWSAFDPEFHEVKENEVYVEREDEFDLIADEVRDEIENGGKRATDRAAIAPAEAEAEADPKPKEEEGVAGDKEPTLALPATAAEAAVAEDAAAAAAAETTTTTTAAPAAVEDATVVDPEEEARKVALREEAEAFLKREEEAAARVKAEEDAKEAAAKAAKEAARAKAAGETAAATPGPGGDAPPPPPTTTTTAEILAKAELESTPAPAVALGLVPPARESVENVFEGRREENAAAAAAIDAAPAPAPAPAPLAIVPATLDEKPAVDPLLSLPADDPHRVAVMATVDAIRKERKAAAAAAAAEELRIEKIKSAAIMRHRAAAAKATKEALNAAKQAEADAANVVIDILTRESGYYTDEGEEDCLHFLPLDLTPAEDAVRIVEERKRRWRAREERKLAEEAAANAVGAVGEKRKERDEDDFREDDEDAEDAEEEAEDEDEEDEDAEVAEEEAEEEADDAGEEREDVEMIDDE